MKIVDIVPHFACVVCASVFCVFTRPPSTHPPLACFIPHLYVSCVFTHHQSPDVRALVEDVLERAENDQTVRSAPFETSILLAANADRGNCIPVSRGGI